MKINGTFHHKKLAVNYKILFYQNIVSMAETALLFADKYTTLLKTINASCQ
jgi:hypothetical protein